MLRFGWTTITLLCLATASCMAQGPPAAETPMVEATVLDEGSACFGPETDSRAVWIDNRRDLAEFYDRLRRGVLGQISPPLPEIDFNRWGALLVSMGQQPTSGYRLTLIGPAATVRANTAVVRIACHRPPPDLLVTQVVTCPWLLIRLARNGYTHIAIRDQDGDPLARIRVN